MSCIECQICFEGAVEKSDDLPALDTSAIDQDINVQAHLLRDLVGNRADLLAIAQIAFDDWSVM